MRTIRFILACAALMAAAYAISPVCAAGEDLGRILDEVVGLRQQGAHDQAVELLQRVISEYPDSIRAVQRAYNELVFTFLSKDDPVSAVESAREALYRFPQLKSDPAYVPPKVGEMFDELRGRIFGILEVNTDSELCLVYLDGTFRGHSPLTIEYVKPGDHSIKLSSPGFNDIEKEIEIEAGVKTNVNVSMSKEEGFVEERKGLRSGFGIGIGSAHPLGDSHIYGEPGFSLQGFGWFSIPWVSFGIIRMPIKGNIFSNDDWGERMLDDGINRIESTSIALEIGVEAEFFKRFRNFEPHVGAGTGLYIVWSLLSLENLETGQEDTWEFVKGRRGWNLSAGMRLYISRSVSIDLVAYYDVVPGTDVYSTSLEQITYDRESLSLFACLFLGAPSFKGR